MSHTPKPQYYLKVRGTDSYIHFDKSKTTKDYIAYTVKRGKIGACVMEYEVAIAFMERFDVNNLVLELLTIH